MILEMLVNMIFGFAMLVIDMIPDLSFGSEFYAAFGSIYDVMNGASYILPTGTMFLCTSVFFILHNTTFVISILNWIIRKVPGVN